MAGSDREDVPAQPSVAVADVARVAGPSLGVVAGAAPVPTAPSGAPESGGQPPEVVAGASDAPTLACPPPSQENGADGEDSAENRGKLLGQNDPRVPAGSFDERMILSRKPDSSTAEKSAASIVSDPAVFDADAVSVKNELIQVIVQYLQDEGYQASSLVVQDEANVKLRNAANKRSQLRRIRRAIMNGEWDDVESILAQKAGTFRNQNQFLYGVYRQQYLELIDSKQSQKALFLLSKKLKPLERFAPSKNDFRDLCYLLTCHSVTECDQFADWDGAIASRSILVDQCARLLDFEAFLSDQASSSASAVPLRGLLSKPSSTAGEAPAEVPPGRLVSLVRQAVAYQVGSSMYKLRGTPRIGTILEDFEFAVVPNTRRRNFAGHTANVKCVSFVGDEGRAIVTGSSDHTARVWGTATGELLGTLYGHRSRIWDVSASTNGSLLATGGADGTVRLWNAASLLDNIGSSSHGAVSSPSHPSTPVASQMPPESPVMMGDSAAFSAAEDMTSTMGTEEGSAVRPARPARIAPLATMGEDGSADVYAVGFHPQGQLLATAGYDNGVRIYDTQTQKLVNTFMGHESAISSVTFNARGTVAVTGSKDATVRYWDVLSGLCIKTISSHLGEVTSVETNATGTLMLTSSKDNSNRLWDMRQCRPIRRFKGHQNTSKNFIRAGFGPMERLVVGGSEDGFVYVWDVDTEDVVGRLGPANGPVYSAKWNASRNLLVSCSQEGLASTWCYEPPAS